MLEDPFAQMRFSELLKEAIVEAENSFDHPFKQYSLFEALEEKILNGELEGYPTKISERPKARAYYGALRLGLYPDQDYEKATDKDEELMDQALKIEVEIQKAKEEHSLNQLKMEKKIRSSLLADLLKFVTRKWILQKHLKQSCRNGQKSIRSKSFFLNEKHPSGPLRIRNNHFLPQTTSKTS